MSAIEVVEVAPEKSIERTRPSKMMKLEKAHRTLAAPSSLDGGNSAERNDDADIDADALTRPEHFEHVHYNFSLDGALNIDEYIGTIRVAAEEPAEDAAASVGEPSGALEYALESGIRSFVRCDPLDGTLRVDEKLLADSYEQIRFAAQAYRRGRLVVSGVGAESQ